MLEGVSEGTNALYVIGICAFFLIAGALLFRKMDKKQGNKEVVVVSNKEAAKLRHENASIHLTDVIEDKLLELLAKGSITDKEYKRWCSRLGSQGLPDLLPRQDQTVEGLKRRIRLRLRWYNWEPVKIPGEGPIQDVKPKYGLAFLNKFRKPVAPTPQGTEAA